MKKSFFHNLIISVSAVLTTSVLIFFVLSYFAETRRIMAPISHPLLATETHPPRIVALMGDGSKAPRGSWQSIADAENSGLWVWLDLRPTIDDNWVVLTHPQLEYATSGSGLIGFKKWSEVEKLKLKNPDGSESPHTLLSLDKVAQDFPKTTFILNFKEYRPGDDKKIDSALNRFQLRERSVIQSEVQGLLNDLRTLDANRVYGVGRAQVAQLQILAMLKLGGLRSLTGDLTIASSDLSRFSHLESWRALITESLRQNRQVFWGDIVKPEHVEEALKLGVSGIITSDPHSICKALHNHGIQSCSLSLK